VNIKKILRANSVDLTRNFTLKTLLLFNAPNENPDPS
jgi:hypothetical protein